MKKSTIRTVLSSAAILRLGVAGLLSAAPLAHAAFDVAINNTGPQSGGSFVAGVWTPTANNSVILVANLLAQLDAGNVTITTAGAGAQAGNITVASAIPLDDLATVAGRTLTLQANNDILVNAPLTQTAPGGDNIANFVNLTLIADSDSTNGGSMTVDADIDTAGGSFTASGRNLSQTATRNLDTAGGSVQATQTGFLSLLGNSITTSGGSVNLSGSADSTINVAITTSGGNITATVSGSGNDWTIGGGLNASGGAGTGSVDIRSNGGDLTLNSSALLTTGGAGTTTLRSAGLMTLSGDVASNGGNIDIDVTGTAGLNVNNTASLSALGGGNSGSIDMATANGNIACSIGSLVRSGTAGSIQIDANGALNDVTMAGTMNAGSGGLVASANRSLSHIGSTTVGGGTVQLGADMNSDGVGTGSFGGTVVLNGSGSVTLRGGDTTVSALVDANGNNVLVQARNAASVSGSILTDGGNVQVSASSGGTGTLTVATTGVLDARLGANAGIVTLGNGSGNVQIDGELRSGSAGRVYMAALGSTGSVNVSASGIVAGGTEPLLGTTLRANNGITIASGAAIGGTGTVTFNADFDNNGTGSIVLNAAVSGNGGVSLSGVDITGNAGSSITAQNEPILISAQGAVDLIDAIDSNGGEISIQAGTTLDLGAGLLASDGGAVTLSSVSSITLTGPVTTSGGSLDADVTGAGNLNIQNDLTTAGGNVDIALVNGMLTSTAGSDINAAGGAGTASVRLESLAASQSILLGGSVASGSGGIRLRAGGNVSLSGPVNPGGGNVELVANSDNGALGNLNVNASVSASGSGTIVLGGVDLTQGGSGTIGAASGIVTGRFTGVATVSRAITSSNGAVKLSARTLTLNAALSGGGGVTLGGSNITGNAGGTIAAQNNAIAIDGSGKVDLIDAIDSNGGTISIKAGTTLDLGAGLLASDGGAVALSSANTMNLTGPVTTSGGSLDADVTGAGALSIQNDLTTSGGNVALTTTNGLLSSTAGSDINASGGAGTASVSLRSLNGAQSLALSGAVIAGSGGLVLRAGNNLDLDTATCAGGAVTLIADSDSSGAGTLQMNGPLGVTGSGNLLMSGNAFTQTVGGTVTLAGGAITGTFAQAVTVTEPIASGGNRIELRAGNGIVASSLISSAPPAGGSGVLRLIGNVNIGTNALVGDADVVLDGGGLDLVITTAFNAAANTELSAARDVIVNAPVSTDAGRDLFITADRNGLVDAGRRGGVLVQSAGSLSAGRHLVVSGVQIADAGGGDEAIRLATSANTATAAGNLRLSSPTNTPSGADLRLAASVLSTGGRVQLDTPQALFQDSGADITALDGDLAVRTGGDMTQSSGSLATVENGRAMVLDVGGNLALESARNFTPTRGDIALRVGGTLTPVNAAFFEFRGDAVSIVSTGGALGSSNNAIQIEANRLATLSGSDQALVASGGLPLRFATVGPVVAGLVDSLTGASIGAVTSAALAASAVTGTGDLLAMSPNELTVDHPVSAGPGGRATLIADTLNLNADVAGIVTGTVATVANIAGTGSIQDGIDATAPTATVNVAAGSYTGNVDAAASGRAIALALGASPGRVTVNGNLTLDANDHLPVEIDGPAAATDYDNLVVTGSVALGSAALEVTFGYAPAAGDSFTLIDRLSSGAVAGTFFNLAEGSTIVASGRTYRVSYLGGTGNEVTLAQIVTIAVQTNPVIGGAVLGGGIYPTGSNVTLTATASAFWLFNGWSDGETSPVRIVSAPTSNVTFTANFIEQTATVFAVAAPVAGGTVSGGGVHQTGSNVLLTATPNTFWTFTGWNDGNTAAVRTIVVPASDITYTANFLRQTASVTVAANPVAGGTVSGGGTFETGSNIVLTATTNLYWLFGGWSDGDTNATRNFTVPATNVSLEALFTQQPGTIALSAQPTNGGTVAGGGTYPAGSNVTISAQAARGWRFLGWNDGVTNATRVLFVSPEGTNLVALFRFKAPQDFDGDGRTDLAVFSPAGGAWRVLGNSGITQSLAYGYVLTQPAAVDYDGDTLADFALFERTRPGRWQIVPSSTATPLTVPNGAPTELPVPADYDGDGAADLATYNRELANWHIRPSGGGASWTQHFGWAEAIPVPADYDGDGRADVAVYHPGSGLWSILNSTAGFSTQQFGWAQAIPVPGDYDGDGRADIAVYVPDGGTWSILKSGGGFALLQWGWPAAAPVSGDFDGDGRYDIAVYHPATGDWYVLYSAGGSRVHRLGGAQALPVAPQFHLNRRFFPAP